MVPSSFTQQFVMCLGESCMTGISKTNAPSTLSRKVSPSVAISGRSVRNEQGPVGADTPTLTRSKPVPVILASGCSRDHTDLGLCLRGFAWSLFSAHDVQSALILLRTVRQPILICSDELENGTWQELLDSAASLHVPPIFILARSALDSESWAEALHLGAYDVVARPFQVEEVLHVVRTAYLCSRRRTSMNVVAAG